jgi:hypothetical protein
LSFFYFYNKILCPTIVLTFFFLLRETRRSLSCQTNPSFRHKFWIPFHVRFRVYNIELTFSHSFSLIMLALCLVLAAACAVAHPVSDPLSSSQASTIKSVAPTFNTASTISAVSNSATFSSSTATSASGSQVAFAGINIAGFDFGCVINGTCDTSATFDVASKGNGIQQMQHFVQDDGLNTFRLPVGWQYLVNNKLGGPLDPTNAAAYDKLVRGCVAVAKMCIIDM